MKILNYQSGWLYSVQMEAIEIVNTYSRFQLSTTWDHFIISHHTRHQDTDNCSETPQPITTWQGQNRLSSGSLIRCHQLECINTAEMFQYTSLYYDKNIVFVKNLHQLINQESFTTSIHQEGLNFLNFNMTSKKLKVTILNVIGGNKLELLLVRKISKMLVNTPCDCALWTCQVCHIHTLMNSSI